MLVALAAFLAIVIGLDRHGRAARSAPASPVRTVHETRGVIVETADDVARYLHERRHHGRIVLHVGRFLHFVEPEDPFPPFDFDTWPGDFTTAPLAGVDHRNLLWTLLRIDVAREIRHLLPESEFDDRAAAVGRSDRSEIVVDEPEGRRVLSSRLPEVDEPVLVVIDAAVLTRADGRALLDDVLRSAIVTDDLVFCLAAGNPAVPDSARDELRRIAEGRADG